MNPKSFQSSTIDHVLHQVNEPRSARRFLVADEVGLGKTRVAQGVIERMMKDGPLDVFYVCSSLSIVHQNRDALLEILPTREEREKAKVDVDRLTLLPKYNVERSRKSRLRLYTLTPGTLPQGKATGRADERALMWRLLCIAVPGLGRHTTIEAEFKRNVSGWNHGLSEDPSVRLRDLARRFRHRLAWRMLGDSSVDANARCLDDTFLERIRHFVSGNNGGRNLIVQSRIALSEAALENLNPQLVIFDEFQRFFETLVPEADTDHTAHDLVDRMLNGGKAGSPVVLMLSATPYRLYTDWSEGAHHHYDQFYKLLGFLFGRDDGKAVPRLKALFREYKDKLQYAEIGSVDVLEIRDQIQEQLSHVMCRTERPRSIEMQADTSVFTLVAAPLQPLDIRMLRHACDSARPRDRFQAPAYWSSIPFAMQAMDNNYVFAAKAGYVRLEGEARKACIWWKNVRQFSAIHHPHPRLRALINDVRPEFLALPWIPPSVTWWPLGGVFEHATAISPRPLSKTLLFSRYRAVPRAIAAALSYEAERYCFSPTQQRARGAKKVAYEYRTEPGAQPKAGLKRRPRPTFIFPRSNVDQAIRSLLMFWPLPRLAALGDPLSLDKATRLSMAAALTEVEQRILAELGLENTSVVGASESTVSAASTVERLHSASWPNLLWAMEHPPKNNRTGADIDGDSGLRIAIKAFVERPLLKNRPKPSVLRELAEIALLGPANILLRAIDRVFGATNDSRQRVQSVARVAMRGLRGYLDLPDFHLLLKTRSRNSHSEAVRKAVWDGNLESSFDEHLAVVRGLGVNQVAPDVEAKALDRLEQALSLGAGRVTFRETGNDSKGNEFRLRCHAAMPFGISGQEKEAESGELHSDSLRIAFNSPFRPHLLATTSIGQEGLDFHVWSNHIAHWDLPSNPVDLEQRDGRVNRYAGLSVRLALKDQCIVSDSYGSPWRNLGERMEEKLDGLAPWWVTPRGTISRTVYIPPFSRLAGDLQQLRTRLSLYRMALGQADQEPLIEALQRRIDESGQNRASMLNWLDEARIHLEPKVRKFRK